MDLRMNRRAAFPSRTGTTQKPDCRSAFRHDLSWAESLSKCWPTRRCGKNTQVRLNLNKVVFQNDTIARFTGFEVLESFVGTAHRKFFGNRGDVVPGAEVQHGHHSGRGAGRRTAH